jgi:SAM-dependent methyltransferase
MMKKIGNPEKKNSELISKIKNAKIDLYYIKNKSDFRNEIIKNIYAEDNVLDIGKGMREKYDYIPSDNKKTLDVNKFEDYPDILFDICENLDLDLKEKYDKIVCLAVLEHVYNPFAAVENLRLMLKKNGFLFGYVPYLYHYHAPKDLKFQDYFRFSKDALIYLLKDFSEFKLYPVRGRLSTPFNLLFAGRWKKYVEKTSLNMFLDNFFSDDKNIKQCSGFNFIAKK